MSGFVVNTQCAFMQHHVVNRVTCFCGLLNLHAPQHRNGCIHWVDQENIALTLEAVGLYSQRSKVRDVSVNAANDCCLASQVPFALSLYRPVAVPAMVTSVPPDDLAVNPPLGSDANAAENASRLKIGAHPFCTGFAFVITLEAVGS